MDRWDDDEAFRVARELHTGPIVSAFQPGNATANCGLAQAPMAALDGLIETAWSFPGFRISYGAFEGARSIRFHTSAGSESQPALDCVRIDLASAPRFIEALRTTDTPVTFEDVRTDSRARPVADALLEVGCGSMLILPLRRDRKPVGIVMMDCESPRTWGAKEFAALDRLAPLIDLTLEHVEAKAELESSRASSARHERRIDAIRGMTDGVATDASRILSAMRKTIGHDPKATRSLLGQLERLVEELERVQGSPARLVEAFDLDRALQQLRPGLDAISPAHIRLRSARPGGVGIKGSLTGVERLLVNLVAHVSREASTRDSVNLELRHSENQPPQLRIYGDGVTVDDALLRVCDGDAVLTSEQICPALWQTRCEALVQDIRLRAEGDTIIVDFPPAELEAGSEQSVG